MPLVLLQLDLKKYLDKIIDPDQTGFISNRYIGENTRLIYDIMHYTEEHDIPGLLLLIEKPSTLYRGILYKKLSPVLISDVILEYG